MARTATRTIIAPSYTYTSHTVPVNAISGKVQRGRGPIRKGDTYRSPASGRVILNRLDGTLSSITVLNGEGVRVCTLDPDAKIL
jgi:hypothetical protein